MLGLECSSIPANMQVSQSGNSVQGIDGPGAMRCLDRSPGCTPVVGGTPTARVRMQSRPGHDNFAPLKSSTASPGGTPHARGQGRLPHVRVCHVDVAGHLEFNPMRCGASSPGCTPLPSTPDSELSDLGIPAQGGERDHEDWYHVNGAHQQSVCNQPGSVPALGVRADRRLSPDSQETDRTAGMHMVVVDHEAGLPNVGSHHLVQCGTGASGNGQRSVSIVCERTNDGFYPLNAGDRSPGHTPATPGLLTSAGGANRNPLDPHIRFISSGHDSFNPLTSSGSPGHTPHANGYAAFAATASPRAGASDAGAPLAGAEPPRRVSICTEVAPQADNFHPLSSGMRSPGHTPRMSVSQAGTVTLACTAGHDDFHPIRSVSHSAGHTPRYYTAESRAGGALCFIPL